jgi:hypothetical protein
VGGWAGKVSKAKKLKKTWVGGGEKIKFQKKKSEIRGKKKLGRGRGENKVTKKKKLRSGLRKCKQKKVNRNGTWIEKRILSMHHPSTLVHSCVLVHSGPANPQKIGQKKIFESNWITPTGRQVGRHGASPVKFLIFLDISPTSLQFNAP